MARKSNKTSEQLRAELLSKLSKIDAIEAEKKFSDIPVIQSLKTSLEDIQSIQANSKPLLSNEGIRSFDVRIRGAQLKVARYTAEKELNTILSKFGATLESNLSAIMGECVKMLNGGADSKTVEAYVTKAQNKFKKEHSETYKQIEQARETANVAIAACNNHSVSNGTSNNGEKKKEFFKQYADPFASI